MESFTAVQVFVSTVGFYCLVLSVLHRCRQAVFSHCPSGLSTGHALTVFLLALSWPLSIGLRGLIASWGYYFNIPIEWVIRLTCFLGLICLIISTRWAVHLKCLAKAGELFKGLTKKEAALLSLIGVLLLFYCYKAALPWADNDETIKYGYIIKLIANGWHYSDVVKIIGGYTHSGSSLALSLDAQLYHLVNDTYLVRLMRLGNLLFSCTAFYAFLSFFNVQRLWKFFSVAYLLCLPELSILGLSLKNDAVVLMFETHAFFLLILSLLTYKKSGKEEDGLHASFLLALLAALLSLFTFATRLSGIFLFVLCFSILLFYVLVNRRSKWNGVHILCLCVVFGVGFLASAGYLSNFLIFNNPIYPFKPPWPFENGMYGTAMLNGEAVSYSEIYKESFNVPGIPHVLRQLYLIFYMGVGIPLIDRYFPLPDYIPMAPHKQISVWAHNPILLIFFVAPFFIRRHKIIGIILSLFVYQLIVWSLGLQYSRIFLGTSTLMITAAAFIMNLILAKNTLLYRLQKLTGLMLVMALLSAFTLHAYWWNKFNFGSGIFYSEEERFRTKNAYFKIKGVYENCPHCELTYSDVKALNSLIKKPRAKIVILSGQVGAIIHVYFKKATLSPYFRAVPYGDYAFVDINILEDKELNNDIRKEFPLELFQSSNQQWLLLGKD